MSENLKMLNYTIHLEAPVLISSAAGDENMSMSRKYLSGSSLLGTFAALYRASKKKDFSGHADPDFASWFLHGGLRFLNGYRMDANRRRTLPIPLSIQASKKAPDHPFDMLFKEGADKDELKKLDDEATKHEEGYGVLEGGALERVGVTTHFNFHHKRADQLRGHSDDENGAIFNYESMQAFDTYSAAIVGDEDALKNFTEWLEKNYHDLTDIEARLGRSRTTQYGKAKLNFSASGPVVVQEVIRPFSSRNIKLASGEFALSCLSPLVLQNEMGHAEVSKTVLSEAVKSVLKKAGLDGSGHKVEITNSFLKPEIHEQYNAKWRTRKPSFSAFQAGSCAVFQLLPKPDKETRQAFENGLESIEQDGLGFRRGEGFGRIAVNWQQSRWFELADGAEEIKKDKQERRKQKPDGEPPAIFGEIITAILKNNIEQRVRRIAADQQRQFERLPTSSLINRLAHLVKNAKDEKEFAALFIDDRGDKSQRGYEKKKLPYETIQRVKSIKNRRETLRDHLCSIDFSKEKWRLLEDLQTEIGGKVEDLQDVVGFSALQERGFQLHLFRVYMNTFFTLMAKRVTEKRTKEGGDA